jgi:hypothetical protein
VVIDSRGVTPTHADIVEVIESWRSLPPEARGEILGLIRSRLPTGKAEKGAE